MVYEFTSWKKLLNKVPLVLYLRLWRQISWSTKLWHYESLISSIKTLFDWILDMNWKLILYMGNLNDLFMARMTHFRKNNSFFQWLHQFLFSSLRTLGNLIQRTKCYFYLKRFSRTTTLSWKTILHGKSYATQNKSTYVVPIFTGSMKERKGRKERKY